MSWMEAIKPGSSATLQLFSKGREMTPTPPPPDLNSMQATYQGQMHQNIKNMTPSPQLHHTPQGYTSPQGYGSQQGYASPQPRPDQQMNDIPRRNKSFSDAAQRDSNVPVDLHQTWPSTTRPPLPQHPEEYTEPINFPTTAFSNRANPGSRATISHLPRNQGPPVPPPRPVLRSRTTPKFTHETEPEEYVVMQPTSPVSPTSPLTQSPLPPSPPSHTPPPPHTLPPPHTPPPPQIPPPSPLKPVPRPRRDRRKENEQVSANNTIDGGHSFSEEPEVDAHNYVTLIGNQRPTSPLTQSLTPTSSLTNAATSSATSSLTNSLTNSMKQMQIQANGNLSPSQEGPLSTLVDQLAANLSPDQQAMLIQMLQQTQPPKQTDEEIEAAWEIPQDPLAKTEGTPSSPIINYEGTDASTLRGGLRKLYFPSPLLISSPLCLPQSATGSHISLSSLSCEVNFILCSSPCFQAEARLCDTSLVWSCVCLSPLLQTEH